MSVTVSIVVPCLNEQGNIPTLLERIRAELAGKESFEAIFVDDGSTDRSLEVLRELAEKYPECHYVSLSRNFGHQQALKAGLDRARGECVIMMDADLQHPPALLGQLINRWREGYDIVYTVRQANLTLPFFKRVSSRLFYKVINCLTEHPIEEGAADFRLVDRRVAAIISSMNDPFLFLRGLIPWLGFKQSSIAYNPDARLSGTTKYSLIKMARLALHGVTSFSVRPLRMATFFGTVMSGIAFAYLVYALLSYFVYHISLPGWSSIVSSILLLGGIQLIMLGIIGEYLGMLYIQSKQRPTYIVREASK
ncbi:MAG: glycosyltransferase family 2 protein [Pseudomonadota bacterium]|jgi:glycosyltransferase involved in cell wall biosynthesis